MSSGAYLVIPADDAPDAMPLYGNLVASRPSRNQVFERHTLLLVYCFRDTSVCLMNYKADGTPFWNQFFVAALRDDTGKVGLDEYVCRHMVALFACSLFIPKVHQTMM